MRQVVALNLAKARRLRQLTQRELGDALTEVTGTPWSQATVSAAESGWKGTSRVRHFDVDELVAFAVVLEFPVTFFLTPPSAAPDGSQVDDEERWLTTTKGSVGPFATVTSSQLKVLLGARKKHIDGGSASSWESWLRYADGPRLADDPAEPVTPEPRRVELIRQMEDLLGQLKRLEQGS
jgi:hypothetical protein